VAGTDGNRGSAQEALDAASAPTQPARTEVEEPDTSSAANKNQGQETLQVPLELALETLYPGDAEAQKGALADCPKSTDRETIRCMVERLFEGDEKAAAYAVELYDRDEIVSGVEAAYSTEVGWRGVIEFVPHLPVGKERQNLQWVAQGFADIDAVMTPMAEAGALPYRTRGLTLKFFRSVDRTTPSAYAIDWSVAYNVDGSLFKSEEAVRETLFHELFHLNDQDHGNWSHQALSTLYEGLMSRCTAKGEKTPSTKCLKPFAPSKTKVKGGTYYAFTVGNGVHEYAAELALRYFQEQRAALLDLKKKPARFKCGGEENAEAWDLISKEFFGGVDWVAACE